MFSSYKLALISPEIRVKKQTEKTPQSSTELSQPVQSLEGNLSPCWFCQMQELLSALSQPCFSVGFCLLSFLFSFPAEALAKLRESVHYGRNWGVSEGEERGRWGKCGRADAKWPGQVGSATDHPVICSRPQWASVLAAFYVWWVDNSFVPFLFLNITLAQLDSKRYLSSS